MNSTVNTIVVPAVPQTPTAVLVLIAYGVIAGIVSVTLDVWIVIALQKCKLSPSTKAIFAYENIVGAIASLVRIFYVPAVTLLPAGSSPYAVDRFVGFLILYHVWGYACSKGLMGINRFVYIAVPTKTEVLTEKRVVAGVVVLVVVVNGAFAAWTIVPGYLLAYNVALGQWGFVGEDRLPQIIVCPIFVYSMMIVSFVCCVKVVQTLIDQKKKVAPATTTAGGIVKKLNSNRHEVGIFLQFLIECVIWFVWSIQFYLMHYLPSLKIVPITILMEFFRTTISLASPLLQLAYVHVIRDGVVESVKWCRSGQTTDNRSNATGTVRRRGTATFGL